MTSSSRLERPSFQLTRGADYAVRAVIHLATFDPPDCVSHPQLARSIAVPMSFLAKVLQRLAAKGFVASARGTRGGYSITEQGRAASLLDVVEAIEGPVLLNTCLAESTPCGRAAWCPAHLAWREAQRRMTEVLSGVTMRRIPEAMTAWLLPGAVLSMIVGLGAHSLYDWSHEEAVAADELLRHKAPFPRRALVFDDVCGAGVH